MKIHAAGADVDVYESVAGNVQLALVSTVDRAGHVRVVAILTPVMALKVAAEIALQAAIAIEQRAGWPRKDAAESAPERTT